jgi:hypothetical protein
MNVLQKMQSIADSFGNSKPIFKISLEGDHDLSLSLVDKYSPPETDDILTNVIKNTWSESFNREKLVYEGSCDLEAAFRSMRAEVVKMYQNNSPLKNPHQSKLGKWFRSDMTFIYNNPSTIGFVELFRYAHEKGILDLRDKENPHVKNVLAVLELMREKYEQ